MPEAVVHLRSVGGKVQMSEGHIAAVSLKSTSITDRELEILARLPRLEDLDLRNTEISEIGTPTSSSTRRRTTSWKPLRETERRSPWKT